MKMISKLLVLLALIFMSQLALATESALDCAAILSQPSQKWINDTSAKNNDSTLAITDAIATYGNCYDQKLQQILSKLNEQNRGPLMGVRGNFNDFKESMKKFMQLALKANSTGGTYDQITYAYAELYFKQFEMYLYQVYQTSATPKEDPKKIAAAKKYLDKSIKRFPKVQAQLNASVKDVLENADQALQPKLKVYEYMIFLLQSPADPPYSQPPF